MSIDGQLGCATLAPLSASPYEAPPSAPIARRAHLGVDEFRREYLLPRIPVVFTDLAQEWPLFHRATPDYFRRRFGAHPVRVLGRRCALGEWLDVLERSSADKPAPYPCKIEIARELRALLPEVTPRFAHSLPDRQGSALIPPQLFAAINNLEVFFGGPGGRFPYLHYDVLHLHAWITQLAGEKEFTLYAPGQEAFLYVNPDLPWQSAMRNHHDPDPLRYPLFRNALAQRVRLRPGETLFLPCGWWHTARSVDFTISIAFDQLGADNWPDFVRDVVAARRREGKPAAARALHTYLNALGAVLAVAERLHANRSELWGRR